MPKKPTRDQLAKFLPTQELIRAFEQLFDLTDGDSTNITAIQQSLAALAVRITETEDAQSEDDINTAAETARTAQIAASLSELAKAVDGLAMVPPIVVGDDVKSGSVRWNMRATTTNASVAVGDWLDCDASGGAITITPPDVAASIGRMLAVSKSDATSNAVTFNGPVNGAASAVTSVQYTVMMLVSTGTEWRMT
jgi:hypothetical protein